MVADTERLARVFLWKQGSAPDVEYARELLRATNPGAYKAVQGDAPPLQLFAHAGPWPDDPWEVAIRDMDTITAPEGTRWTDPAHYDLAGWQGKDVRTEENIFVVTAYRRPTQAAAFDEIAPDAGKATTLEPVAYTPYQPQYPTGPLAWPPRSSTHRESGAGDTGGERTQAAAYYPSRYSPLETGPIETAAPTAPDNLTGPLAAAVQATLLDSLAPYYVGFGPRFAAALIDLFFTMVFPFMAAITLLVRGGSSDGNAMLGQYALLACLGLLVAGAYHVVQVALWGQTLGKALLGIKVVALDGEPPGFGRAFLRVLGYGFSLLLAGWGFLRIALDPRRQALHDRLAETLVVPERVEKAVPPGLPGYRTEGAVSQQSQQGAGVALSATPLTGMASVAGVQEYDRALLSTIPQLPQTLLMPPGLPGIGEVDLTATPPSSFPGVDTHSVRTGQSRKPIVDKARALFKQGLAQLENGSTQGAMGFKVEQGMARTAATLLKEALELVPNSVVYRYFYAVALRYSEGMEPALRELKRVLESDPGHYEAQQQVTYGARWHDAFAYPAWVSPAPVEVGAPLPPAILELLPEGSDAVTRIVLLREGGNKRIAFLSRTPLSAWSSPPSLHMEARLHLTLSSTAHGPILAVYVVMSDGVHEPYIGEAFLNPREPVDNAEDACRLGQHILEQLARQDRTYFIFADERNRLLLSRKVTFNTTTQVSIARVLYEVQSLPQQPIEAERFVQAARWHMEHVSLEQVREQLSGEEDRR